VGSHSGVCRCIPMTQHANAFIKDFDILRISALKQKYIALECYHQQGQTKDPVITTLFPNPARDWFPLGRFAKAA
jgi:hypothetical protein